MKSRWLAAQANGKEIAAPSILREVLLHLGPIWPSRLSLAGVPLGDCWKHLAIKTDDATSGLVPLHKLSQWLTYSLIEPLQRAGLDVNDVDGLTGLAEYRNGGLFVDLGVLTLRDAADAERAHQNASPMEMWNATRDPGSGLGVPSGSHGVVRLTRTLQPHGSTYISHAPTIIGFTFTFGWSYGPVVY